MQRNPLFSLIAVLFSLLALPETAFAQGQTAPSGIEAQMQLECDGGNIKACHRAAHYFSYGLRGFPIDPAKAKVLYQKACDGNDGDACLKFLPFDSLVTNTPSPVVLPALEKACAGKSGQACLILATLYSLDFGVTAEMSAAEKQNLRARNEVARGTFLGLACEYGNPKACNYIQYNILAHLKNAPGDRLVTVPYALKACDGGIDQSCRKLEFMVIPSEYTEKSELLTPEELARLVKIFVSACENQEPSGCLLEAYAHFAGVGGFAKDEAQGLALARKSEALFRASCDAEIVMRCVGLAERYREDFFILAGSEERLKVLRYEYLNKACDFGQSEVCDYLKVKGRLNISIPAGQK